LVRGFSVGFSIGKGWCKLILDKITQDYINGVKFK